MLVLGLSRKTNNEPYPREIKERIKKTIDAKTAEKIEISAKSTKAIPKGM
jgi:hypothetical protein